MIARALILATALIVGLCALSPRSTSAQTRVSRFITIDDHGFVHIPYTFGQPPHITCAPNVVCTLALSGAATIQDIVCPDSVKRYKDTGWIVNPGQAGITPYIYVSPQLSRGSTTLFVTTSNGATYSIILVAQQRVPYWNYVLDPPIAKRLSTPQPIATAQPSAVSAEPPSPTPTADSDFRIGKGIFRPVSVTRLNGITTIVLPDGNYPWPDVAEQDKATLIPVQHSDDPDTRTIAVLGYYDNLVLYSGVDANRIAIPIQHFIPTPAPASRGSR